MQVFDQNAFAGRGSSLMNSNDLSPSGMERGLEDFEERLVHQENKTFRAVILAMMLAALALALAATFIVRA